MDRRDSHMQILRAVHDSGITASYIVSLFSGQNENRCEYVLNQRERETQ